MSPLPRDIAVLAADAAGGGVDAYEKAFEVRDKPVRFSEVALFGRTCVDRGVREAAMVLLAESQPAIDLEEVRRLRFSGQSDKLSADRSKEA